MLEQLVVIIECDDNLGNTCSLPVTGDVGISYLVSAVGSIVNKEDSFIDSTCNISPDVELLCSNEMQDEESEE
jgi:hypothetical protein